MHQSIETPIAPQPFSGQPAPQPSERGQQATAGRNGNGPASAPSEVASIANSVAKFVEQNPLLAAAGTVTIGAALVLAARSRATAPPRIDQRARRAVRSLEKSFNREMRALRNTDVSTRMEQFGSAVGGALGQVDLASLSNQARDLLAAARKRVGT
ncbi:MAG: hypothetical protein R3D67_21805 [Hyphomicrobiaceae bacterium]